MIAFVSSNRNISNTSVPVHYLNLSAFLSARGISNDIIEIKKKAPLTKKSGQDQELELFKILERKNYDYIGLSAYTTDFLSVMKLAVRLKTRFKNAKIILGGVHVTLRPKDPFFDQSPVDIAVIGEGEFALLDIIRGKALKDVEGIAFKGDDGNIVVNQAKSRGNDLSHLPLPAYEKIDMEFYLSPSNGLIRFMPLSGISIFTGFGCPYNCLFCANNNLAKAQNHKAPVRYKSLDQVFEELHFLKSRYNLEAFYIQDDTFTMDKARVRAFCQRLIREIPGFLWGAETRVDLLDEELVVNMKKAGCCQLDFGVEAATQEALDRMRKGIKIDGIKNAFTLCRKHKIRSAANFMLNIPGETEEDVACAPRFLKELKADVNFIALTVPFIGTPIYEQYVEPKLSLKEYSLFEKPYLFSRLVDERFKLAAHNLPLTGILMRLRMRFMMPKALFDVPLKIYYLKYFLRSRHKMALIKFTFSNFFVCIWGWSRFLSRRSKTAALSRG